MEAYGRGLNEIISDLLESVGKAIREYKIGAISTDDMLVRLIEFKKMMICEGHVINNI